MKKFIDKVFPIMTVAIFMNIFLGFNVFAKELLAEEEIAPGVLRQEYTVNYENKNSIVNLLKIDLNNPYVEISVVAGGGKYTNRATVSEMANRTDATALVNGDFFNTLLQGSPEGPSIVDGKLQTSPVEYVGLYSLGITDDNTASIEEIDFSGTVTAKNGNSFKLDSLNKSYYWYEPTGEYSHQDKLNLYNDFWASKSRGDKKNSEILVSADGVVEQISEGKSFDFPVPEGKFIIQADGKGYEFIKNNVNIGDRISINYSITPNKNYKFLIGGHALLADNSSPVEYTKDIKVLGGVRARTAAGVSADGKTLFIASVEGRTKRSAGLSLGNLSDFMVSVGVYRAVNLDGGGSTAMVLKELGDFDRTRVVNPEKNAAERKVVNGIGIYNKAPDSDNLTGVKIGGPSTLLVGQSGEYKLKGAWNEFLKPLSIEGINYRLYASDESLGVFNGNYYLPLQEGAVDILLATDSGVTGSKKVNIVGFDKIKDLKISLDTRRVSEGSVIFPTTSALLNNKEEHILSPKVLKYDIDNFDYSMDENGNIIIHSLNENKFATLKIMAGEKSKTLKLYDAGANIIQMKIDETKYNINEEAFEMDTKPFIKDDRTLVPVRFIVEALKGDVQYDEKNRIVNMVYDGKIIIIPIDDDKIIVNDEVITMDTTAIIKDSRTFIPIRFIAESIGMIVDYEDSTREVTLIENKDSLQ
ncbi:MAG: stalk domain-containing protein [Peptoniphilus sp.]|nr:stalk domain-containing protein [Peptoniphilus sp.]